mmetsp:Transcript_22027/g.68723  ORF Transcript_22027/g.68723 Transcript_22027/m.68723 type:complete len:238 (+) Transcript_22027:83-796(+)|eukprot:CAMPEP_0204601186 /NCGR_PEP_ID=MMETSP0661-20131031/55880_1 /ASSEMBLY_ACC=CAM_ASM_000606 /TAXON_ID=109239 /ORGANISM="Alexandrium margalefi, Strain AMGDE01CS-322" /LENGTH=237 /DNA_ID=CAMNT_0051612033 /DNA_START=83 /DNA_END=796 /DNA_ORIENTATION=-
MRPMNMFCCGCPLSVGVVIILTFNLLQNLFYIATSFCNVILKIPTFGVNDGLILQTFNGAWAMLGLPVIIIGFLGVASRLESHVRVYYVYLLMSVALDLGFLVFDIFIKDICDATPNILQKHGSAFACGFMRSAAVLIIILVLVIESYFVFTVWSLCEDLRMAPSGTALPDLLRNAHEAHKHRHRHPLADVLYGAPITPGYPRAYGTLSTRGLGNTGTRIGSGYHSEPDIPRAERLI